MAQLILIVLLICNKLVDNVVESKLNSIIPIKLSKSPSSSQFNLNEVEFSVISARLIGQRSETNGTKPSTFIGPDILQQKIANKCFLHDDSKYIYRVCPFSNVTQHEKSKYSFNFLANSFHGILGIWKEWNVVNNSFDSLLYTDGDECGSNQKRSIRVELKCSDDLIGTELSYVKNVTEVKRCIYKAEMVSGLFCGLGSVYSYLNSTGRAEWDAIETVYHNDKLTKLGYEHYIQMLLAKYGIVSETTAGGEVEEQVETERSTEIEKCRLRIKELENENKELKIKLYN